MNFMGEIQMDVQERLISAALGALWGALAGVLLAMFLSYVGGHAFDAGWFIATWKSTILACALVFALLGLVLGVSTATVLGRVLAWLWSLVTQDDSRGLLADYGIWIKLLVLGIFAAAIYFYVS